MAAILYRVTPKKTGSSVFSFHNLIIQLFLGRINEAIPEGILRWLFHTCFNSLISILFAVKLLLMHSVWLDKVCWWIMCPQSVMILLQKYMLRLKNGIMKWENANPCFGHPVHTWNCTLKILPGLYVCPLLSICTPSSSHWLSGKHMRAAAHLPMLAFTPPSNVMPHTLPHGRPRPWVSVVGVTAANSYSVAAL